MYLQYGIHFASEPESGMRPFAYKWYHKATGNSDTVVVYCRAAEDFLELLSKWNIPGHFIYYPICLEE